MGGQGKRKNRDIALLEKVKDMEAEMEALERKLQWQRDRLKQVTRYIASGPRGAGQCGMDEVMATLDELERDYREKVKTYRKELRRGERILNGIESQQMRLFVRLMYMDKQNPGDVRKKMGLSRWSFNAARDSVENAECMAAVKWYDRRREENSNRSGEETC